jgi:hypothetical protein
MFCKGLKYHVDRQAEGKNLVNFLFAAKNSRGVVKTVSIMFTGRARVVGKHQQTQQVSQILTKR